MVNIITIILIFCIVLFIYLHVYFHYKTSNDLEVYEIDQPSKYKLEEICDLRQPVVFMFNNENIVSTCNNENINNSYGGIEINFRNTKKTTYNEELYIPLSFNNALNVVKKDKESQYITENNKDFLDETGLGKCFKCNDMFLRPYMMSCSEYDYLFGSSNATTPFRYNLNYRNYYYVTHGEIKLKLAPPKCVKYLYENKDYENFEFNSPLNPWDIQSQYKNDFDKINCLEVIIKKGQIIFIPAFWWYSIKFLSDSSVCSFKYRTYMNDISLMPYTILKVLQSQNIKRNRFNSLILKKNSPINDVPINDVPINDVPINDVPINDVPINDVPINNVPINNVPINNVLINDVPNSTI